MPQIAQESSLSLNDLIKNFEVALLLQSDGAIKELWAENPKIQAWFHGRPVDFSSNESEQPDIRIVSDEELLLHFKSVLTSRIPYVIQSMWDDNVRLQHVIRDLDNRKSIDLFHHVLNSLPGDNEFISQYVNWLDSIRIVQAVVEERQAQISLLQNCLTTVLGIAQANSQDINSKKQKAPPKATSSRSKRQKQQQPEALNVLSPSPENIRLQPSPVLATGPVAIINAFKSSLEARKVKDIKAMWEEHSMLHQWLGGKQVDFNDKKLGEPDLRTISLDELKELFNLVLKSRVHRVLKKMWRDNEILRVHYSDNGVCYLDDFMSSFRLALPNRVSSVIHGMWDGNPKLKAYLRGQTVDFGRNGQHDRCKISNDDLIMNFKAVLAGRFFAVVQAMWNGNDRLKRVIKDLNNHHARELLDKVLNSWRYNNEFIVQYVNWLDNRNVISTVLDVKRASKESIKHSQQIQLLQKRLDTLDAQSRISPVPEYIVLQVSPELASEPVVISDPQVMINPAPGYGILAASPELANEPVAIPDTQTMVNPNSGYIILPTSPELTSGPAAIIAAFKATLETRNMKDISAQWNEHSLLADWFRGRPVNFSSLESRVSDIRTISFDELRENFELVRDARVPYIFKTMWSENPLLRKYYSDRGREYINEFGQSVRHIASLDDLSSTFISALILKAPLIISDLWNGSALLKAYFSGQVVELGQNGQSDPSQIPDDELIRNFKYILASKKPYAIEAMWKDNDRLHRVLRVLDPIVSIKILDKVLSSLHGRDTFVVIYLNWLDNVDVIRAALEKRRANQDSKINRRQIGLLQNRLDAVTAELPVAEVPVPTEVIFGGTNPPPTFFSHSPNASNAGMVNEVSNLIPNLFFT